MSTVTTLFPPFLNQGSRDTVFGSGPVCFLQNLLFSLGCAVEGLKVNVNYEGKTAASVRKLQDSLGFTGDDVDGNFGPGTRRRLKEQRGIDVDAIPHNVTRAGLCKYVHPDHEEPLDWPDKRAA